MPEITTVVHTLDATRTACMLCEAAVPLPHRGAPGEYVAVIQYGGEHRSSYRIGKFNRQSSCGGSRYDQIHQGPKD